MHPTIRKLNWVFFQEGINDFDASLADLVKLLRSHTDYVDQHTRFLVKALKWERNQKSHRWLLRDNNTVKLWNRQGELLHTLSGHEDWVYSVTFSPEGNTIASASYDKTVRLWNLQGQLLHTLSGHQGSVYSVAFSPDGNTIANPHLIKLSSSRQ